MTSNRLTDTLPLSHRSAIHREEVQTMSRVRQALTIAAVTCGPLVFMSIELAPRVRY